MTVRFALSRDDRAVWVTATVRSELLSTAPERAGLAEVVDDSLVIEPLSRARLPIVIKQPGQRAGLQFAPGLVEQMAAYMTGGDPFRCSLFMPTGLGASSGTRIDDAADRPGGHVDVVLLRADDDLEGAA
jgi:hypothetical protein